MRLLGLLAMLAAATAAASEPSTTPAPTPQFVYVLKVEPQWHDETKWTDTERTAVSAHFQRLKAETEAGRVILAGKTDEQLDTTFGLVIFEASNAAEAREFMNGDPAVQAGVMRATLHPYRVALQRK